jgi:Eco47II-like restriction endonuclease
MSYLNYIGDDELEEIVRIVLDKGIARKKEAEKKFTKNVIDPFGSLFEAAAFNVDHNTWKSSETIRQCQKTLQNHVGDLHQKILGKVNGWEDLSVGSVVDLVNEDEKIIAEVKNKYSTVTGGKLADQYYSLERLVMPKSSKYKGYTAYFVNIIPKKPVRINDTFEPSDKDKGAKCAENPLIRIIDGASFYSLVTGQDKAIFDFYSVLPNVIEMIFTKHYNMPKFKIPDKTEFAKYFDLAYKK